MIRLTGENILALLNRETPGWAKASRLDWTADGISTDTRTIHPGDLFVPLKGERFDGHAYVAQAALADANNGLTAEQIAAITPYASAYDPSKEY